VIPQSPVGGGSPTGDWSALAGEQYCYLTTRGRVTGRPHRIEIWFAIDDEKLYMLSGGGARSDWVKNLSLTPAVTVEIAAGRFHGRARVVTDPAEGELARALVHDKYAAGYRGDLTGWRRSALPIAVDLGEAADG
jgi:deazaflavin-dependent oxidoreductase (nitroreductase family)